MSRRAPSGPPATQAGWVYTLCLMPAYPVVPGPGGQQARHYTGFAVDLIARLMTHAGGGPDAARLLQVQKEAGGTWALAAVEPGTRDREAQLKERGATRRCPMCKAAAAGAPLPVVRVPGLGFLVTGPLVLSPALTGPPGPVLPAGAPGRPPATRKGQQASGRRATRAGQ